MQLKLAGGRLRINLLLIPICILLILRGGGARFAAFACALLLHECAHLLTASALGVRVYCLELLPFGCAARMEELSCTTGGREVLIAMAGPFANFLAAAACYAAQAQLSGEFLFLLLRSNLVLGAMNLLPSLPLDGGRVAAVMMSLFLKRRTANTAACVLGMIAGTGICASGFLPQGPNRLSALVMGGFMLISSIRELRPEKLEMMAASAVKSRRMQGRITELRGIAAPADRTLGELMLMLDRRKYHMICILDDEMRIRRVMSEGELMERLFREGTGARLLK